jgi:hypothetical protein
LNFFGNAHTQAYFRRHLNLSLGAVVESVFESSGVENHHLRGVLALTGVVRSADARWEGNLQMEIRPALVGTIAGEMGNFADWAAEARLRGFRHFVLNTEGRDNSYYVLSVGAEAQVNYSEHPQLSFGAFASDRDPLAVYLGAVLRVSYEFSHY